MQTELRQFIEQARYHKGTVLRVAELLPAGDAALDELIAETVREANQTGFTYVVMAALVTGRPVSVRHLSRGTMLMPHCLFLGWIAWHMKGELPEPLLEAVQQTQLARDAEATALYVIAAWCQQHRNGILPDGVLAAARTLARVKPDASRPHLLQMAATLRALAALTGDAALGAIILQHHGAPNVAGVKQFMEETLGQFYGEAVAGVLPEAPMNTLATGTTMRRAVARIGRNEPCPCGSGKKYKHCCIEKDQERLHHSSEVAGHTRAEMESSPEQHLTAARLDKAMPHELVRLDPKKIPAGLIKPYFLRLTG
ncbi:MAG: SEC-C metal-binding domain-containing protein, partial [Verrucomicrobiota bacterium]